MTVDLSTGGWFLAGWMACWAVTFGAVCVPGLLRRLVARVRPDFGGRWTVDQ